LLEKGRRHNTTVPFGKWIKRGKRAPKTHTKRSPKCRAQAEEA